MNKTKKVKIFLLEDDSNLNDTIVDFLESKNYAVESAFDGDEAADFLYENSYDLLLLDVNVPKMNGFQLLKEARENGVNAPAIFITSLNSVDDLEEGFESGCDDYIRKPFELKELLIRVETLLKREFFHQNQKFIEITEHIQYDIKNNELVVDERHINLGNKEAKLLKLFMQHIGEIVSHEVIFQSLWDYDEEPSDTSLRTYIKNLRKIIGKDCIESVKKQGYKFVTC
ncbi:MAG: response regulator transcription factor [Sulfurovaceae bacterium]|nr:response regulator transcription factor [Sulfurovaceae bacterium]MDD5547970.1 response regulator transcription factor [Sulfurovaceae bacterium]